MTVNIEAYPSLRAGVDIEFSGYTSFIDQAARTGVDILNTMLKSHIVICQQTIDIVLYFPRFP